MNGRVVASGVIIATAGDSRKMGVLGESDLWLWAKKLMESLGVNGCSSLPNRIWEDCWPPQMSSRRFPVVEQPSFAHSDLKDSNFKFFDIDGFWEFTINSGKYNYSSTSSGFKEQCSTTDFQRSVKIDTFGSHSWLIYNHDMLEETFVVFCRPPWADCWWLFEQTFLVKRISCGPVGATGKHPRMRLSAGIPMMRVCLM